MIYIVYQHGVLGIGEGTKQLLELAYMKVSMLFKQNFFGKKISFL